jgi:hypothetical protein
VKRKRRIFLSIAEKLFVTVGVAGVRSGSVFDELPFITPSSLVFMVAMLKGLESG